MMNSDNPPIQERMSRRKSEPQAFDNNYNTDTTPNNIPDSDNQTTNLTTHNKHTRSDDRIEEIYRKFKNDTGYVGHGPHANYDKRQPDFVPQPMLPPQLPLSSSSSCSTAVKPPATTPKRSHQHQTRSKPLPSTTIHQKLAADETIGSTPLASIRDVLEAIPSASHDFYDPRLAESTETAPGKSESEDDYDDELMSEDDLSSGGKKLLGSLSDKDKLTAKEKNREHAKNTRMRKKNYIESLKESIKLMVDEREKIDRERKVAFSRLQEQITVRKKVLQEVLEYRASGVLDAALWGTLLEESIIFVLPVTPYRSFPPLEVYQGQRYIRGIPAIIVDTASFYCMLQTVVPPVNMNKIKSSFICNFNKAVLEENSVMCVFDMKTLNGVEVGCRCDLTIHGMLKAVFSPYNKLIFLELTFDVMMFMQQLRRASGRGDFLVIPNTPYLAQEQPNEGRVITESVPPYRIVYVSEGWQHLFGFRREHILGKTCKILQGEKTETDKVDELMEFVRSFLPCSTVITNYSASGQVFPNWIRIFPLYTEGIVTHFLGIMENLNYSKLPSPLAGHPKITPSQPNNIQQSNHQTNNTVNSHNNSVVVDASVVKTSRPTTGLSSISLAFRQSQQKRPINNTTGTVSMDDSGPVASALTRRLFASAPTQNNATTNNATQQPPPPQIPQNKSVPPSPGFNGDHAASDEFLYGLLKDFAKDSSHNSSDQNFQTHNPFDTPHNSDQSNSNHSNGNNSLLGDLTESMVTSPNRVNNEGDQSNQGTDFYLPNGDDADMIMSDGEESFDENLLSY